ncbi:Trihelix transcription factor GT-2 [Frankliniella fusca]|uniref:Trihelix transcription factor GT-2 n=1 Tax=Frankliniella fusca TaxID=407009 RepID=A0AAE1H066_9NEOP|nr:Trihelix transcription factor GT-2 [Frankliniella fusca]KAK3933188.1 Trihelix transcription factor GT-2 [Frankliniella fusca]
MENRQDFVSVEFQDPINGRSVTVQLSPADAENVKNDLAFAQRIMELAFATEDSKKQVEQHNGQQATTSNSSGSSSSNQSLSETDDSSCFKWSHAAILLLVDTFKIYESDLVGGKISQKKVWERIAANLCEYGHNVTGPQCMSKFNGMKRTFKAISDHNSKSGNNPRTWPYFELMQSLLGERPFMEPLALASSSGASVRLRQPSESSSLEGSSEFSDATPRKRKRNSVAMSDLAAAIMESRKIAEEGKNKRHQEKLSRTDALLTKLDLLLEKF